MEKDPDDRLLTVRELATHLNVNECTVLKLVSEEHFRGQGRQPVAISQGHDRYVAR